ncbi:hypothetical protein AB0O76_03615 [Streptomyces sp. NPDC086554]|uniref:SCO2400 family protein n=1 Tax=Streptomyces sp. NPDC086554 TaxID=3154864 RepID=UPI00342F3644
MDYCHPCHRHLNGALACPGCGTPAEACREYTEAVAEQEEADGPEGAYDEEAPRVRGRRRKERGRKAHRRRRRRILLVTAGLALAAGGLSLAELATEGPSDDPTAASAADGGTGERPAARESAGRDDETAYDEGVTATASATPTASASATDKDEAARKKKSKEAKEREADKADDGADSQAPATTSAPDTPGTPQTPRPAPPPTSQKPVPTPEPTPSETCDRFLWWCT